MSPSSSTTPLLDPIYPSSEHANNPPSTENTVIHTPPASRETDHLPPQQVRNLTFLDAFAIVLGLQIGSGLFVSPSLVVRDVQSEPIALAIWIFAGFLAWACAACFIELGIRIPLNGGPQEYLCACFGDVLGFIASYACIFGIKPSSTAMLGLIISDYLCDAFGVGQIVWWRKGLAGLVVVFVGVVNCGGNRASNVVTKLLVVSKLLGVGFVLVIGTAAQLGLKGLLSGDEVDVITLGMTENTTARDGVRFSSYTEAVLAALWGYSGWETLSYVAGDLKDPGRNIARVINTSMLVVVIISILMNLAYFSTLSYEQIILSNTIGLTFSKHFLGDAGSIVYALIICLSTLGSLNVKIFTAGRLTQAAAIRGYVMPCLRTIARPEPEEESSEAYHDTGSRAQKLPFWRQPLVFGSGLTPVSAIAFNTAIALMYLVVGEFSSLVTFMGCIEYSVILLSIFGLVALRFRSQKAESPPEDSIPFHAAWSLMFIAIVATSIIIIASMVKHPISGAAFVLFCGLSAVLYYQGGRVLSTQ